VDVVLQLALALLLGRHLLEGGIVQDNGVLELRHVHQYVLLRVLHVHGLDPWHHDALGLARNS